MVNRLCRAAANSFVVLTLFLSMTACGGGKSSTAAGTAPTAAVDNTGSRSGATSSSRDVVARVGGVPITRAAVSHWMTALAGTDYYALAGEQALPNGLLSDPPNYRQCVARLEAVTAVSPKSQRETGVQFLSKCRQLYEALKTQAVEFLIKTQATIAEDRELGVTVTDKEVRDSFNKTRKTAYPSEPELQQYLSARKLDLSDLLLETRLNLLAQKMTQKVLREGAHKVFVELSEAGLRWDQTTTCHSGYVVEHCKQFKGGGTYPYSPPASVMIEKLTAVVTGRCYNPAVCTNSQ
jgi:hypothetical protein